MDIPLDSQTESTWCICPWGSCCWRCPSHWDVCQCSPWHQCIPPPAPSPVPGSSSPAIILWDNKTERSTEHTASNIGLTDFNINYYKQKREYVTEIAATRVAFAPKNSNRFVWYLYFISLEVDVRDGKFVDVVARQSVMEVVWEDLCVILTAPRQYQPSSGPWNIVTWQV